MKPHALALLLVTACSAVRAVAPIAKPIIVAACENELPPEWQWICKLTDAELDAEIAKARGETPIGRELAEVPAISRRDKEHLLARMKGAPLKE